MKNKIEQPQDKIVEYAESIFGKMRNLTKEEIKAIDKYIESISEHTGKSFWDLVNTEAEHE